MRTRHKHIAFLVLIVSLLLVNKLEAFAFYSDTTQLRIEFDCEILYNGTSIADGDVISVRGNALSTSNVDGEFKNDTNLIIYVEADSSFDLLADYSGLSLKYYNSRRQCSSFNVEYTIDEARSDSGQLIINSCIISDHYFAYTNNVFCVGEGIVYPETDIPLEDVMVVSYNLQTKDSIALDIVNADPGNYPVYVITDYCLSVGSDSIDVTIEQPTSAAIPDTLVQCGSQMDMVEVLTDYNVYGIGWGNEMVIVSTFVNSGFYVFKPVNGSRCVTADTAYVEVVEADGLEVVAEEYCDKVVLNINSEVKENSSIDWSNGENTQTIEVYETDIISVDYKDKYGCIQTKSIDVEVTPLVVEEVEYRKEESDCWDDGAIEIQKILTSFELGNLEYSLINTITGITVERMDNVPEGVYQIEVIDSRGCTSVFPEKITVKQKCLEEYPVFSPDQDGLEDEYFIPHEGIVKIYNRNGTLLNELNTPDYWDGTDFSGNLMPMGNYVMVTETGRVVNITIVR